jgi:hypothetical protein
VAVFDPAGDVSTSAKEIVREEISSIIVNTPGYAVLERQLIDKVLEENKFQMGGMVDNSQIGEIGKKMGANAVFVASITPTGSNLYLSFKLIDVQTARIERQRTGRTSRGESDLDVVVQKIVGEMFAGAGAASAKAQEAKPAQPARAAAASRQPSGALIADGMDVFRQGRELSRGEVRSLLANTDALRIYNKGVSRRRSGTAMVWGGIIAAPLGAMLSMYELGGNAEEAITFGVAVGVPLVVTGITFRIVGKYTVKKAVKSYNAGQYSSSLGYTPELQLGFTGSGVGLVYRF